MLDCVVGTIFLACALGLRRDIQKHYRTTQHSRISVPLHVICYRVLRIHNVIIIYFMAVAQGSFGCSVGMSKKRQV